MIRREGSRRPVRGAWRVLRETVRTCVQHRATGLAAEGAFFAVLALPPLIFGLAGSLGFVIGAFGDAAVAAVKADLIRVARRALTADSVREVLVPTLDSVLDTGRVDIVSIGFLIALWSGSRALHVVMDGITIMYGKNGVRGVVKARLFSFWAYVVGLGFAVIVLPLVLAGPEILAFLLPETLHFLRAAYWPAIAVVSTAFLGAFFHVTQPRTPDRRPSWRSDLPGAVVVMLVWIAGSQLLRVFLAHAIGASIYGPLAAPIVILLWLYLIVFAVLVGAAVNAAIASERSEQTGQVTTRTAARTDVADAKA